MIILLSILFVISLAYQLYCWLLVEKFYRNELKSSPRPYPCRISQIKPIHRIDSSSLDYLKSFVEQDYPYPHEVIFVTSDPTDPALEIASKLTGPVCLVKGAPLSGANRKVAALCAAFPHCRYDIIVVSDADMKAPPFYLRSIATTFTDPEIGMATALYCPSEITSWEQALEGISMLDFCSSVLVARQLEGITFGLGATMAVRRQALKDIGGFESLLNYLADDYQLGHKIHQTGWKIVLLPLVLDAKLPDMTLRSYFVHQLRWMITYRVSRPLGHFAYIITQGLLWALSIVLLYGSGLSPILLWIATRIIITHRIWYLLSKRHLLPWPFYTPLKDLIYLVLWICSFVTRRVRWGEQSLEITSNGTIKTRP